MSLGFDRLIVDVPSRMICVVFVDDTFILFFSNGEFWYHSLQSLDEIDNPFMLL